MSLMNCPECNKEISDKAILCPHCGYPISALSSSYTKEEELYDVINVGLHTTWGQTPGKADALLRKFYGLTIFSDKEEALKCYKIINSNNTKIIEGISIKKAEYVKSLFQRYCEIKILPSESTTNNDCIVQKYQNTLTAPVTCPRCGSTAITTGERGFSLISGFLGSNKTTNRCAKCGWSWQP